MNYGERMVLKLAVVLMLLSAGCAGAFGGYGPGLSNVDRTSSGCVQDGPLMQKCSSHSYNSGERSYGAQIGVRTGAVSGSAGTIGSGTGLAIDAHADFTVAMAKWGAGLQFGYSNDQLFGDSKLFYWGLPVVAYGQYALTRRILVHAGGGRVLHGVVRQDETSADASAWRGVAGISFVFARNAHRDFALRLEARAQKSGDAEINSMDASWSSTALLGEIVWATF